MLVSKKNLTFYGEKIYVLNKNASFQILTYWPILPDVFILVIILFHTNDNIFKNKENEYLWKKLSCETLYLTFPFNAKTQ